MTRVPVDDDSERKPLFETTATLRPCAWCGGGEFLRIDDFDFANESWMTDYVMLVCTGCGKAEWFVPDPEALRDGAEVVTVTPSRA
jgi:hypothetical protein